MNYDRYDAMTVSNAMPYDADVIPQRTIWMSPEHEMEHKLAMSEGRAECEYCPGCEDLDDIFDPRGVSMDPADYFWCHCDDCTLERT